MKSQVAQRKVMIKNEVKTEMIKGWCRGLSRPRLITVVALIKRSLKINKLM